MRLIEKFNWSDLCRFFRYNTDFWLVIFVVSMICVFPAYSASNELENVIESDQFESDIWLLTDIQSEEVNLYIQEEPIVIDRDHLQTKLKFFLDSDLIKKWKMQIFDPVTLEFLFTLNGTAEELGNSLECNLNENQRDQYYCMLTVFYTDQTPLESKPYIFFINRQEIKDNSESNSKELTENSGEFTFIDQEEFIVEKPGKIQIEQFFMVGFADLTLGKTDFKNHVEPVSELDEFWEGIYLDGHLALYLKGKIQGKYLLTAQIDTDEKPVKEMFNNLTRKDSSYILQTIEPDTYYPVYGDESVSSNEIDTEGKLYLKVEWDHSEILWGNYRIGLNETEIMNFNRKLYGARVHLESPVIVDSDQIQTKTDLFWAEALTLHSRDELKATGGLLYYLRHEDISNQSEKLTVELRDSVSGRVIHSYPLEVGRDYKIDWLNGIIILNRSIESTINSEELISNHESYLIAEYEFNSQSDLDNSTYGLRTSHYFTDTLKLSGSFFREKVADGKGYQLYGFDALYKLQENTYLTAEWANSGKVLSGSFYSEDGGLTYTEMPELDGKSNGRAIALGLNIDLSEQLTEVSNLNLGLNYKFYEKGFSTSKTQALHDINQLDLELSTDFVTGYLSDYSLVSKYSYKKDHRSTSTGTLHLINDHSDSLKITRELKYQSTQEPNQKESSNLVGAVRFEYKPDDFTTIYSNPQFTLKSNGEAQRDHRITLGLEKSVDDRTHINYEASVGDFGCRFDLGGDYDFALNNNIYGKILFDVDRQKKEKTLLTLGHRGKLTDLIGMYVEHQLGYGELEDSITDIIGLDYNPTANWAFFVDYTKKKIERLVGHSTDLISRNLISSGATYNSEHIEYSTRLQAKQDRGAENVEEYLMTNSLEWDINYMISLLVGFDYSLTKTDVNEEDNKQSVRGDLGLAYRPTEHDRLNLFGKYTYLYKSPLEEVGLYSKEQAQIIAFEGMYDLTEKWQLGEKIAYKNAKTIFDNDSDKWVESETYLWVNRLNYHLINKWDLNGEYRILFNPLAKDKKSGFLVAVYYRISPDFKIGGGYNFADFSDDLTDLSYQAKGPFVNLIVLW